MNIDEYISKANDLVKRLAEGTPSITQVIALDTVAAIRSRLQEKGQKADGSLFKGYSEKEVPAFFYYNKPPVSKTRPFVKKRQKEGRGISYKDYKEQIYGTGDKRNFTVTGDMLRLLNIVSEGQQGKKYVVTIGGKTDFAQDKIDWNSEDEGDILLVSKQEEKNAVDTYNDEIERIIKQSGV